MTLNQLQYFLAVCQHQNITKAAEELHISQPSVTAAIKDLESEFHCNLFCRVNRKLELTPEGQLFQLRAGQIISEVDLLTADIKDLSGNRNHIKLGLPLQIGVFLLPLLVKDFKKAHPEIRLELMECGAMEIAELILEEKLDFAIASLDIKHQSLTWMPLFQSEFCFCIRKSHPLAEQASVTLADACTVPSVMFPEGFYANQRIMERSIEEQVRVDVALYTRQLHTIKNLVRRADLGSFLLRDAVVFDTDIAAVPFDPPLQAAVGLITKKGRHIYKDSQILIDFIKQCCPKATS